MGNLDYRNFQNIFEKSVDIRAKVWYSILAGGRYVILKIKYN